MAKELTRILPSVKPLQGSKSRADLRDRYLFSFQHPHRVSYNSWASYYGSDPNAVTRMVWKVPTGITQAKFELWGGGGMGAGSSCCQQGFPGGSGAYAYKDISVTSGDRYVLCLGEPTCQCCWNLCTDASMAQGVLRKQLGVKGPTAYVLGNGLTNFCAEGGNPGISVFCPGYNLHNVVPDDIGIDCCCVCWTTCRIFTDGQTGMCRTLDSDNDIMRCACFYGADGGERGSRSYFKTSCCGQQANDNACGQRVGTPYPGGLWERPGRAGKGGIVEHNNGTWCCYCCGCSNLQDQHFNAMFSGTPQAWYKITRGVGGASASTANGATNICGSRGGPSAIFISYC